MNVSFTPARKIGKFVVHACVDAVGQSYRMSAQVTPTGLNFSFFSDYSDGLCMLTKENKKQYDALKIACLAELEKHKI